MVRVECGCLWGNSIYRAGENFHTLFHQAHAGKVRSSLPDIREPHGDGTGSADTASASGLDFFSQPGGPQGMDNCLASFGLDGFAGYINIYSFHSIS